MSDALSRRMDVDGIPLERLAELLDDLAVRCSEEIKELATSDMNEMTAAARLSVEASSYRTASRFLRMRSKV